MANQDRTHAMGLLHDAHRLGNAVVEAIRKAEPDQIKRLARVAFRAANAYRDYVRSTSSRPVDRD